MRLLTSIARHFIVFSTVLYSAGLIIFLVSSTSLADRWWIALAANFTPVYFLPLLVALPLMLILRARLALVLSLILTLYALTQYGPYFLTQVTRPQPDWTTLRVITYNLSERSTSPEDATRWLREQNADLVLLQEILPSRALLQGAVDIFPELNDLYPYRVGSILATEGSGAAILSRFPLRAPYVGASFVRSAVVVGSQPVAVYNVSLPAPLRARPRQPIYLTNNVVNALWDLAWAYDQRLHDQEMSALLQQIAAEPFPAIVGGDFNMSEYTPGYRQWPSRLGDSFRAVGNGFGWTWPAGKWPPAPILVRLDYIWHSPIFQPLKAEVGPFLGSDHLPVLAEFQVQPPM
ncbi:MAG: endonuclease/exonuclease/phosphatase family protein [Chloroflexi bacterium]|nr:endonuclease/exonuclease/phosphatase family protein [Chloroflexota bacterium]